jgi:hypothetical protein
MKNYPNDPVRPVPQGKIDSQFGANTDVNGG